MNLCQTGGAARQEISESSADMKLENRQLEEQMQEIRSETEKLLAAMKVLEEENEARNRQHRGGHGSPGDGKRKRETEARRSFRRSSWRRLALSQKEDFLLENMKRLAGRRQKSFERETEALSGGTEQSAEAVAGQKKRNRSAVRVGLKRRKSERPRSRRKPRQSIGGERGKEQAETDRLLREAGRAFRPDFQALDKEAFRLQNQKEKLEERQEGLVNYMWSEYELTYSTAAELSRR